MQLTTIITLALASASVLAAPAPQPPNPTTFPANIQTSLQTFQGEILNVISDYANKVDINTRNTDYSTIGRSLDFFLRDAFLPFGPSGCPQVSQPLPAQATSSTEAIGYMQQAQLFLIYVSQDAINNNFPQATYDVCQAIRLYGAAALSTIPS